MIWPCSSVSVVLKPEAMAEKLGSEDPNIRNIAFDDILRSDPDLFFRLRSTVIQEATEAAKRHKDTKPLTSTEQTAAMEAFRDSVQGRATSMFSPIYQMLMTFEVDVRQLPWPAVDAFVQFVTGTVRMSPRDTRTLAERLSGDDAADRQAALRGLNQTDPDGVPFVEHLRLAIEAERESLFPTAVPSLDVRSRFPTDTEMTEALATFNRLTEENPRLLVRLQTLFDPPPNPDAAEAVTRFPRLFPTCPEAVSALRAMMTAAGRRTAVIDELCALWKENLPNRLGAPRLNNTDVERGPGGRIIGGHTLGEHSEREILERRVTTELADQIQAHLPTAPTPTDQNEAMERLRERINVTDGDPLLLMELMDHSRSYYPDHVEAADAARDLAIACGMPVAAADQLQAAWIGDTKLGSNLNSYGKNAVYPIPPDIADEMQLTARKLYRKIFPVLPLEATRYASGDYNPGIALKVLEQSGRFQHTATYERARAAYGKGLETVALAVQEPYAASAEDRQAALDRLLDRHNCNIRYELSAASSDPPRLGQTLQNIYNLCNAHNASDMKNPPSADVIRAVFTAMGMPEFEIDKLLAILNRTDRKGWQIRKELGYDYFIPTTALYSVQRQLVERQRQVEADRAARRGAAANGEPATA